VTSYEQLKQSFEYSLKYFSKAGVDIVINNAGIMGKLNDLKSADPAAAARDRRVCCAAGLLQPVCDIHGV